MTTKTITSGTYADGSFGLRAKSNGDSMTVWFCGGTIRPGVNAPAPAGNNISPRPCVHRTRKDARCCDRRHA